MYPLAIIKKKKKLYSRKVRAFLEMKLCILAKQANSILNWIAHNEIHLSLKCVNKWSADLASRSVKLAQKNCLSIAWVADHLFLLLWREWLQHHNKCLIGNLFLNDLHNCRQVWHICILYLGTNVIVNYVMWTISSEDDLFKVSSSHRLILFTGH